MGLATGTQSKASKSVIVYMATYIVAMTAGTFGILIAMHRNGQMPWRACQQTWRAFPARAPRLGLAMMIFMFSLCRHSAFRWLLSASCMCSWRL